MRALLIRHAASSGQAAEAPLSKEGDAQAKRLVPLLTRLRVGPLYASPYRRAQETLVPYAEISAQKISLLDGLRERVLSPVSLPDWQDHIKQSFQDQDYAPKGGESHNDLRFRASESLEKIEQLGGVLPTFVTHGGLTSALFNGIDPDFSFAEWKSLRNPDIFEVKISQGKIISFQRQELAVHG